MLTKQLFQFGASLGALWLSFALPGAAQSVPVAPAPSTVAPLPVTYTPLVTRQDTAAAVHELFRSRRGGGIGWLALGTAGLLASILPAQQSTSAGVWTPGVMAGTALVGIGLNKSIQFRKSRERLVLQELAATGHLPISVSRRLKGNFLPVPGNPSWPAVGKPSAVPSPIVSAPAPVSATDTAVVAAVPLSVPALGSLAASSYSRADSVNAVLGLFMAKRFAGQLPALLLTGIGGTLTRAGGSDREFNYTTGQFEEQEPSGTAVAVGLALAFGGVTYMYIHNAPYSMAKFEALKTAYNAGAPLPVDLRRQIKPQHFEQGREWQKRLARKAARKRR